MALSKEQEMTVPKEIRNIRPDTTVEWNPQVLEDWMAEQGDVSMQWMSEQLGKNQFYLYKCKQRKRIGKDALIKLQDLTNIPKSFFMGNAMPEKEEIVEEKKETPVRVYTAPAEEFGIETEKRPEQVEDMPETKGTIPKGWISLSSPECNYFVRADDIVQIRQLLNGTRVLTNHGTFDVLENGLTIMERMAE